MSKNTITIDVSDQLLDKVLSFLAITSQQNALQGAMPMLMGAMGSQGAPPKETPKDKPSMGFKMDGDK
tara:strand:+ start:635 stop:838 length:204 start_codon:yes stop_codon:yes gene_type:complete